MNAVQPGSLLCPKQKSEPVTYLFTGNSSSIVLGRLAKRYQKPKRFVHKTQRKYIPPTSYQEKMVRTTETHTMNPPPVLVLRLSNTYIKDREPLEDINLQRTKTQRKLRSKINLPTGRYCLQ